MSGFTPECSQAKNRPVLQKPVCTSSTISSAPCASQMSRTAVKNPASPIRTPPSPCTISTITAAVSSPTAARSLSALLNGTNSNPSSRGS